MEHEAMGSITSLAEVGAAIMAQRGTADVGLARCMALSVALRAIPGSSRDVVLMIDDDMVFKIEQAQQLVDHARASGRPCSGSYVTGNGRLAATWTGKAWLTGLGFLAIPVSVLTALAETLPRFDAQGITDLIEFTYSKSELVEGGKRRLWIPEDYRLCTNLGEVELLPICVGHIKKRVLFPNADELPQFIEDVKRGLKQ